MTSGFTKPPGRFNTRDYCAFPARLEAADATASTDARAQAASIIANACSIAD
jgi:hypothetical protein